MRKGIGLITQVSAALLAPSLSIFEISETAFKGSTTSGLNTSASLSYFTHKDWWSNKYITFPYSQRDFYEHTLSIDNELKKYPMLKRTVC